MLVTTSTVESVAPVLAAVSCGIPYVYSAAVDDEGVKPEKETVTDCVVVGALFVIRMARLPLCCCRTE